MTCSNAARCQLIISMHRCAKKAASYYSPPRRLEVVAVCSSLLASCWVDYARNRLRLRDGKDVVQPYATRTWLVHFSRIPHTPYLPSPLNNPQQPLKLYDRYLTTCSGPSARSLPVRAAVHSMLIRSHWQREDTSNDKRNTIGNAYLFLPKA